MSRYGAPSEELDCLQTDVGLKPLSFEGGGKRLTDMFI